MHYGLDRQAEIWIQELEEKLSRKLEAECRRLGSIMPYVPENGVYYDMGARELNAWTNGFFAGMADVSRNGKGVLQRICRTN